MDMMRTIGALSWTRYPIDAHGSMCWGLLPGPGADIPPEGTEIVLPGDPGKPSYRLIVTGTVTQPCGTAVISVTRAPGTRELEWIDAFEPPGREFWPMHMDRPDEPGYHVGQRRRLMAAAEHVRRFSPAAVLSYNP